jgi:hypothetical protein
MEDLIPNPVDIRRGAVLDDPSTHTRRIEHLILTTAPEPVRSGDMAKATIRPGKGIVATPPVESLIHVIRSQKVMLDIDLAALYGVTTKAFNQAVKRNAARFPADFMFRLDDRETAVLRSQIVTASKRNVRFQPLAFTEHGVAMLSAVLHSDSAVQMSIAIIRTFVRLRQIIEANKDIAARVEKLERGHDRSASVIEILVEDIDRLAHEVKEMKVFPAPSKRKIGFDLGDDK